MVNIIEEEECKLWAIISSERLQLARWKSASVPVLVSRKSESVHQM